MLDNGDLSFTEYQLATASTAVYPGAGNGSMLALCYLGLGLGEAGEVQGKIKKILRDDEGVLSPEKRDQIGDELSDLLWYVARLSDELGLSLEQVAIRNMEKLADRKARGVIKGSGDNR